MYTFVDFTSQIAGRRGVPCPTNKGVSYTNLVWWLGRDLKNRLLLLLRSMVTINIIIIKKHGDNQNRLTVCNPKYELDAKLLEVI
jgi:hypothetical protein